MVRSPLLTISETFVVWLNSQSLGTLLLSVSHGRFIGMGSSPLWRLTHARRSAQLLSHICLR